MKSEKADHINHRFRWFAHWTPLGVVLLAVLKAAGIWTALSWWAIVGILFIPLAIRLIGWIWVLGCVLYAAKKLSSQEKNREGL